MNTTALDLRRRTRLAIGPTLVVWLLASACADREISRDELLESAWEKQRSGEFAATVEPLRAYLETHGDDAEANYLYGRALSRTVPHLAIWSLRKAAEDPEWFVPAGMQQAVVSLAADDFDEAIRITSGILERDPENLAALAIRANAHAHSKTAPELAIADARRVLELDPGALEAYEPLILGLLGLDRLEEARQALEEVGRSQEEWQTDKRQLSWHCVTTALFQLQSQEVAAARETFEKCLAADPGSLDVVTTSVQFFDSVGEPERSNQILRTALDGNPASRPLRLTLANRLADQGQVDAGDQLLLEATSSENPHRSASAWLDVAKYRQGLEQYGPAADALERAAEALPPGDASTGPVGFELADALVLADRLDRALEVANSLPVPAHRHLIRGRALQEQGHAAEALVELERAIELWPDNPWARYYAALAAQQVGDFQRALVGFRNSVRILPNAADARERAADQLVDEGRLLAARIFLLTEPDEAPLRTEGLILTAYMHGATGDTEGLLEAINRVAAVDPDRTPDALAAGAAGVALREDDGVAVEMLLTAPIGLRDPDNANALRALVRHAHAAGVIDERRDVLNAVLDEHPDSAAYAGVRALDLELSGAPPAEVRAAWERALALDPEEAHALVGRAKLLATGDLARALQDLDRAAALLPTDPEPRLAAARALRAAGRVDEAAARLDELLVAQPHLGEAAYERASIDVEHGRVGDASLERASRAVRFGGGEDARELERRIRDELGG